MANTLGRVRTVALVLAVVCGLFAWTTPWWEVSYPLGASTPLGWSEVAPLSVSLALAALAGAGAAALMTGQAHRVLAVLVLVLTMGSLVSLVLLPHDPTVVPLVEEQVAQLTGKSIQSALEDGTLGIQGNRWGVATALSALTLLSLSAVVSVVSPRESGRRFERSGDGSGGDPWDQLSHGVDPTTR